MNDDSDLLIRLSFENYIWLTFIIVSAIDIYGDELIKKSIRENDPKAKKKAEHIFLFIALVSILVYIYFFYRNYKDYMVRKSNDYLLRLIGSSLVLVGTLCLLFFQLYPSNNTELPSNI